MQTFFSVAIIIFLKTFSPAQDNSLIDWKAGEKLSWSDFKKEPDPSSPNAALDTTVRQCVTVQI